MNTTTHATPVSASQKRLLAEFGEPSPREYGDAKKTLEARGLQGSGIPYGMTWRQAAAMPLTDLMMAARLPRVIEDAKPDRY